MRSPPTSPAVTIQVGGIDVVDVVARVRRWRSTRAGRAMTVGYDLVPFVLDDDVRDDDLGAAVAICPDATAGDVAALAAHRHVLGRWLAGVPSDATLWGADERLVDHVGAVACLVPDVDRALVSAALHRKRPHLVPLTGTHVMGRHPAVVGEGSPWRETVRVIADDVATPERRLPIAVAAATLRAELRRTERHEVISLLRFVDLALRA